MLSLFLVMLAGAATPRPALTSAVLAAADGAQLATIESLPRGAQRGVVLVHQAKRNKEDWWTLAERFARAGYAVVAVDLRGHGGSASASPAELGRADYAAMVSDVRAAVDHLENHAVREVAVVGVELGANLAINAAVEEPAVVSVVMVSPGLDYQGVITTDAVKRYGPRSLLLVAAADDPYSAKSAGILDASATGAHEFRLLETGGRGMKLVGSEPALEGWLAGWVSTHWAASAPAPSTAAPAATLGTTPMETAAPTLGP